MKAFVTGGTGFVGSHLVRVLLAEGATVRCLVRRTSPRDNLEGLDVEVVEGDLTDAAGLDLADCDHLFHCAADYRLWVPDPDAMYRANVDGTRELLRAAAGMHRIVYTSTVGALGLVEGGVADERTPTSLEQMIGHYKRSKFLAEREAEKAAKDGAPVVIVNPSTPVGELDIKPTATGKIIVDFLNGKMPAYVDTGLNLIDVRDCAAGHLLAARRGRVGERYILGNENLSLREMLGLLAELTGRPAPRIRLPHWIPQLAASVSTGWARLVGGEPAVPLDAVRMARHRMYFDASKAVDELGLPQNPVREALGRAIAWFRANGYAS